MAPPEHDAQELPLRVRRRDAAQEAILLIGSAVMLGLSIWRLPPSEGLLRPPSTPFDRTDAVASAPDYRLFVQASSILPPGSSVTAISEPRNSVRETSLHRMAVALLPHQKVFAAALWDVARPDLEKQADFVIVAGTRPASPPGKLLFEVPWGSVWRRQAP